MSRWQLGLSEWWADSFHLARLRRRCPDSVQAAAGASLSSLGLRRFICRIAGFAALVGSLLVCELPETSHAQQPDFGVYARAVELCRGVVKRPLALDLDKRILCFDGPILSGQDFSPANALEPNGLFVVRSYGGEAALAIALADFLRERGATVVVYDYCFSACASFLLIASREAVVMKDTLVAWHHTSWPLCPSLEAPKDRGPKRLEKWVCPESAQKYQRGMEEFKKQADEFYASRVVDSLFEQPPESFTIRKLLRSMFEGTGTYPDVVWTWNPRYYASTLKTKIIYEAYPRSQDEVDALVSKLPSYVRVLYDP